MDHSLREATRQWTLAVPVVSAFISSLVRDFQDRDDILQETAVAVLQGYHRYDPARPFTAWAMGIARLQTLAHLRKKGADRLVFDSAAVDAAERLGQSSNTVAKALQRVRDRLRDCIERKATALEAKP